MKIILSILSILSAYAATAQTYADSIALHRKKYKEELLAETRQPIKPAEIGNISFFPANAKYRLVADFKETVGSKPFMIATHSGKQKPYKEYGTITFTLDGEQHTLHAYQSVDLVKNDAYKDHVFVPFHDRTNYESSYGGGRYIDLSVTDIHNGKIVLDFNKCYNPYCAYSEGFNCPIPPDENSLHIEIPAGEKTFVH